MCRKWVLLVAVEENFFFLDNTLPLEVSLLESALLHITLLGTRTEAVGPGAPAVLDPKSGSQLGNQMFFPHPDVSWQKTICIWAINNTKFSYPPQQPLHQNCMDSPCSMLTPQAPSTWGNLLWLLVPCGFPGTLVDLVLVHFLKWFYESFLSLS